MRGLKLLILLSISKLLANVLEFNKGVEKKGPITRFANCFWGFFGGGGGGGGVGWGITKCLWVGAVVKVEAPPTPRHSPCKGKPCIYTKWSQKPETPKL